MRLRIRRPRRRVRVFDRDLHWKEMQNPNSSSSMVDSTSGPKRYTPPNQRNRSSNRRRSRGSFHSNEGESSQPVAVGFQRENSSPKIISLEGCSRSEAFQLLSDRWAAAMHLYNDPSIDLSERPMMYYGGDVWGKLPH